jgi:hypothetical protein
LSPICTRYTAIRIKRDNLSKKISFLRSTIPQLKHCRQFWPSRLHHFLTTREGRGSLAVRHPESIDRARTTGSEILRKELNKSPEEYAAVRGNIPETTLLELIETRTPKTFEDLGVASLPHVIGDPRLGQSIWEMNWQLLNLSASKWKLLTSDRPLLIMPGLGDPNCYIAIPLGPAVAFVASRDRKVFERLAQRRTPTEIARALNETFVSQADTHVYGSDDSQLRFVENHLRRRERS